MRLDKLKANIADSIGIELPLQNIIHVGANTGQEAVVYERLGLNGVHIEAHPLFFKDLQSACEKTQRQRAILACCDAQVGNTVRFNVSNNKQSSSMLPLGRHAVAYPDIRMVEEIVLETTTLDALNDADQLLADPHMMVLDVQGAESRVLQGAPKLLATPTLWGIIAEVSLDPVYDGGCAFDDLYAEALKPAGFFLFRARFNRHGWTNAVFLKRWWRVEKDLEAPLERLAAQ